MCSKTVNKICQNLWVVDGLSTTLRFGLAIAELQQELRIEQKEEKYY
ncbi:hypothetical protein [Nostoc sp.]